jgi:hypothetical protein
MRGACVAARETELRSVTVEWGAEAVAAGAAIMSAAATEAQAPVTPARKCMKLLPKGFLECAAP